MNVQHKYLNCFNRCQQLLPAGTTRIRSHRPPVVVVVVLVEMERDVIFWRADTEELGPFNHADAIALV